MVKIKETGENHDRTLQKYSTVKNDGTGTGITYGSRVQLF